MNAKVFGEINIRPAVKRHQSPERQVGHVLHRGQSQDRGAAAEHPVELFVMCHRRRQATVWVGLVPAFRTPTPVLCAQGISEPISIVPRSAAWVTPCFRSPRHFQLLLRIETAGVLASAPTFPPTAAPDDKRARAAAPRWLTAAPVRAIFGRAA